MPSLITYELLLQRPNDLMTAERIDLMTLKHYALCALRFASVTTDYSLSPIYTARSTKRLA
jgi:hypothetical protein